ncbi:MAG: LysM peptidoglycan-binding domain-containing protein [Planctomycetes bacterium]|jgi:nucleoid-associated protein YgaU|nr:LysM peptidoglycan-binding domain-containing protein [Planctomycetota bacterium]
MGKDYRIGLMVGAVLVVVALVWVATRPSLSSRPLPTRTPPANDLPAPPSGNPAVARLPSPAPVAGGPVPQAAERLETARRDTTERPADASPVPPASSPGDLTIYEKDEPIKTTRFHIVRPGESLSSIAQQYYGTPNQWRKILAANEKAVKDANKIAPGTKLILP